MRTLGFAVLGALTACSPRVEATQDVDAAIPPVDAIDAPAPLGPFTTITLVPGINDPSAQDDDPTLTADLLEIYFDSARFASGGGQGDIWFASRSSIDEPFGAPVLVSELASPADDTTPDISPDGLTLYFGSDRTTAGNRDLYVTTRRSRTSAWSAPQRVVELASSADDSGAMETADGLLLVLASGRGGTKDIYFARRASRGEPWGPPVAVPALSSMSTEDQHWVDATASEIYFSSDLPGSASTDIYRATRIPGTDDFTTPVRVDELSTADQDVDPWLSPDGRTLFFTSGRSGGGDIYMATR